MPNFSKAVTTGARSGSGKIVYEFLWKWKNCCIWGGFAQTKSLQFEVERDDYANKGGYDDSDYEHEEFMENGYSPVDPNERSHESSLAANLASNFGKVTEAPNRGNKKV